MANKEISQYWQGYREARLYVLMRGLHSTWLEDALSEYPEAGNQFKLGFAKGLDNLNKELKKLVDGASDE